MPAGIQPEKRYVQLVRDPSDRMPIRGVEGAERPCDGPRGQPAGDGSVFVDIDVIVEINKIEPDDLAVNHQAGESDQARDYEILFSLRNKFGSRRRYRLVRSLLATFLSHYLIFLLPCEMFACSRKR